MKKLFRKNQIIITALALMIAVAGYVSYTQTNTADESVATASEEVADTYEISDEDTVAEIFTDTEDDTQTASADTSEDGAETGNDSADASGDSTEETGESGDGAESTDDTGDGDASDMSETDASDVGETVLTSTGTTVDFASEVKLNREQVRSKNKETLLEIINSTSLSDAQKQDAVDAMIAMTDVAERENAAELLLQAKGFTDVVVSITDDSADVVLNMGDVTDAKRAQVEDIVKRKTGISAENIVITPISETADS
ncbi:MAG: SpoIIIAH-like family protein [Clostridiales bacterium]|nr:SpoIIIAH-like family protein [Clostridiales bacterium]MCD8132350.1 SpoIIIAH-like family protein [Clostridiales bacterium]